jgi:hypothetical protein
MNLFGGSLSIINTNDDSESSSTGVNSIEISNPDQSYSVTSQAGREFLIEDLSPFEEITVDNDLQIITSSLGEYRINNFNKNWFRYVSGNNNLNIRGNISSLSFTHQFVRKIA